MAYKIEEKIVIAVASSALFDLEESHRVFQDQGEDKYRIYQRDNELKILGQGVAFPLIKRLLNINTESTQPVEVVLLSRNDPDTGLRVFKSIEHYKLPISRAVFVTGNNPFRYMEAFNASLFLSANSEDVEKAVAKGYPAGCIYPSEFVDNEDDHELRLAFDFDGIVADDSAETIYQEGKLKEFQIHETKNANEPLPQGPLFRFFHEISKLQKIVSEIRKNDPSYKMKIRVAIATARNAPAHERVITTLRKFDIRVDEAFFLGGIDKARVLSIFQPHIFFDDQKSHIESVAKVAPSVHVPFGITNLKVDLDVHQTTYNIV
ncbi:5'-nucleotidase [Paenibacillus sp. SYP-B4298]|uniref:5'-nucleotidase n=1 Tax=Paenibacillus sp. SYP-B4298 TaxID=2996034 RepID=UPI0022DDDD04|nr:5'-nucleotidase [Paenibacillus sp. SYP-B4298]